MVNVILQLDFQMRRVDVGKSQRAWREGQKRSWHSYHSRQQRRDNAM